MKNKIALLGFLITLFSINSFAVPTITIASVIPSHPIAGSCITVKYNAADFDDYTPIFYVQISDGGTTFDPLANAESIGWGTGGNADENNPAFLSATIPATLTPGAYAIRIYYKNRNNQLLTSTNTPGLTVINAPTTASITIDPLTDLHYNPGGHIDLYFSSDIPSQTAYRFQISHINSCTFDDPSPTNTIDPFTVQASPSHFQIPLTIPAWVAGTYHFRLIRQNPLTFGSDNGQAITIGPYSDLYIRDRPDDEGHEPYDNSTDVMWLSEDIWVKHTDASGGEVDNPQHSAQHNYVYVNVMNHANATAPSNGTETVHLYWATGSTGLGWPAPWTGETYDCNGTALKLGGEIGPSQTLTAPIVPNSSQVLKFVWNDIPNPSNYSCLGGNNAHFCLLARITRSDMPNDGMTFPETIGDHADLVENVKNNNNIAWRNIVFDADGGAIVPGGAISPGEEGSDGDGSSPSTDTSGSESAMVANFTNQPMPIKLAFKILDENGKETTFDKGVLKVTLRGKLLENLKRDGVNCTKGNVNKGDGVFTIMQPGVGLDHIVLDPHEAANIRLQFLTNNPKDQLKPFAITVSQIAVENGTDRLIGGQTYVFGKVAIFKTAGSDPNPHPIPKPFPWLWVILILVIIVIVIIIVIRRRK